MELLIKRIKVFIVDFYDGGDLNLSWLILVYRLICNVFIGFVLNLLMFGCEFRMLFEVIYYLVVFNG